MTYDIDQAACPLCGQQIASEAVDCPHCGSYLGEGGRMVVPVGDVANQTLTVVEKVRGEMKTRSCGDCKFVKLVGKYAWDA